MAKQISGIIPPVITSFDQNGNFNEKSQREIIRFLLPHIQGFYPVGTYGSGPLMVAEERKKVAEVIIDEVAGKVPVIIHVGAASTAQTVELARHAEAAGADAVAAIPPYYYKYPEKDLLDYFRAILQAVKVPVFAYNNPGLSNNPLTAKIIKTLADEGLAGLKDSAFDLVTFYEFLYTVTNPNFTHIVGTEAIAAPAVQAGAKGVVSGLANVWPELMAELWSALQANDARQAAQRQLRVNQARAIMKYGPTLVVCYEALKMRGVDAGYPRRPYSLLSEEVREKIKAAFTQMGLFR
ncbi:MAG: dihydrodipicolinate synthase family protein [Chloroflexi bacterium]|jgi:dihydrodipicolinate synthase/N-acetylneuraminate lyase|nr:dihydrodipicolinate synthase family protein [Chloroflexota bacterium]